MLVQIVGLFQDVSMYPPSRGSSWPSWPLIDKCQGLTPSSPPVASALQSAVKFKFGARSVAACSLVVGRHAAKFFVQGQSSLDPVADASGPQYPTLLQRTTAYKAEYKACR